MPEKEACLIFGVKAWDLIIEGRANVKLPKGFMPVYSHVVNVTDRPVFPKIFWFPNTGKIVPAKFVIKSFLFIDVMLRQISV